MGRIIQVIFILFSVLFIINLRAKTHIENEYILKLKQDKSNTTLSFFEEKSLGKREIIKSVAGMMHVKLDKKELNILKRLHSNNIEFIEPNFIYTIPKLEIEDQIVPSGQWGLNETPGVNAEKAWSITKGKKSVVVAVIDTGVDYTHYALKNSMWTNTKEKLDGEDTDGNGYIDDIHGFNFVDYNGNPMDDHNHGTHCAGIIAADSPKLKGIAPKVSIMALKFLSKNGKGTLEGAISSIEYAVNNGADVLSNSWGSRNLSKALKEAIQYAEKNGVLFVAAAGNDNLNNDEKPTYPAGYYVKNVISVAALDKYGKRAYFSNYGKKSVDLFAPGRSILSSVIGNKTKIYSGTSMATPFVSGAAALFISEYGHVNYNIIKEAIFGSVDYSNSLKDYVKTGGRLDAYRMLLNN